MFWIWSEGEAPILEILLNWVSQRTVILSSNNNWLANYEGICVWSIRYLRCSEILHSYIWVISFLKPWLADGFNVNTEQDKHPALCSYQLYWVMACSLVCQLDASWNPTATVTTLLLLLHWGVSSTDLRCVEYSFTAITPRTTQTWIDSTY